MKKITAFAIVIFVASLFTFGQQISFGVKSSFIILEAKYIEKPSFSGLKLGSRNSYAAGITMQTQISKLFGVQIEPRFIIKGYNINWGENENDIYRNSYISLPGLLYFSPIHNFSIQLGPEFAYLIDSKMRYYNGESFRDYKSPDEKHFELSLITGIGYNFLNRFDFGIRYGIGLTPYEKGKLDIFDGSFYVGPLPEIYYKIFNRYFELYLNTRILTKVKNN
jgi:hypothetical protein